MKLDNLKRVHSLAVLAVIMVLVAGVSCSTKKNTFTRRAYHNLTAHYNAYFNGKEAYKEGVAELAKKSQDNFAKVIPVFQHGTKEDAQSVYNLFDRAIEKGSIVIQRHSIYIKRVEHVKWIDDAYLLIGKSYLYKQEYDLAAQTFAFIRERYKNSTIVYDAVLYQMQTYNQLGRFRDAEALISLVDKKIEKNKANRHIEKLFPLVMADYHLQQGEYDKSVEFLEQAYRLNKGKKIRTRLSFILAQVFQRTGDPAKATEYYKKVLNYNPAYEMAFAAKINIAKCFDATAGDSKMIKKILRRMLNDEKNKDFLDQIYYALAEVYLKEKDEAAGIENLKLSARSSTMNNYQKGLSYLKLGDIYYASTEYKPAQMFYDSAVMFLPKDYPNFSLIESKKDMLTDLVNNLNIVELEDSLQHLGHMPYNERMAHIDNIIAEIVKEERRKAQEEIDRQNALNNIRNLGFDQQANQPGNQWYFYNPQMLAMGQTEFDKKWGKRKLEDLWRLSNKVVSDFSTGNDDQAASDSVKADSSDNAFDPKNRNAYIKAIPITPDAFVKSDNKIMEALFNIGAIYKDGLNDYDKAINAFETLFKRFPENPFLMQSYYYLYRIYVETEVPAKANFYKDLILTRYPESDYAKIINDPNYYMKIDSIGDLEEVFYGQVFQAYSNKQYGYVVQTADSALKKFKDKNVIPKFAYLRAISLGKLFGDSLLVPALNSIVAKYNYSPVSKMAQDLLNVKTGKPQAIKSVTPTDTIPGIKKLPDTESPYVYDPEGFHFYIAVFDAVKVKIGEIKNLFSDHNTALYKLDKLTVNSMFLTNDLQLIMVNRFDNKIKAMDYYTSVNNNAAIMAKLGPANIKSFVISANNYSNFYRLKNVQQYMDFFKINYLNQ
jgi:tetratricopeptide (TPR) repeat protein